MSITINGSGDINATGNDIELNSTGTTDVTLALGGGSVGIGTATPTQKLTVVGDMSVDTNTLYVDSANNRVGVGTASPTATLESIGGQLRIAASIASSMFLVNPSTTYSDGVDLQATYNGGGSYGPMKFSAGGSERMRLLSTGALLINATAYADVGLSISYPDSSGVYSRTGNTSSVYHYRFHNPNGLVGGILTSGSATSYQTSSDYRLKEDWQPMLGSIDRVKVLNPVNFAWKVDGSRVDGFLAHEVQPIVPEAVSGEKDGMRTEEYEVTPAVLDDDGNVVTEAVMGTREVPDYQGIDQAKLVPLLTQALKDAITKIEALETANADMLARIEALEAV